MNAHRNALKLICIWTERLTSQTTCFYFWNAVYPVCPVRDSRINTSGIPPKLLYLYQTARCQIPHNSRENLKSRSPPHTHTYTPYLNNSLQHNPSSEADSSAARHDIPNLHYTVDSSRSPILYRARWIQPTSIRHVPLRAILISPIYVQVFQFVSFLHVFLRNPCVNFSRSPTHVTCPAHLIFLCCHPNDVWWAAQIMKLPNTQFVPVRWYFCPLDTLGLCSSLRPSFTPKPRSRQNYSSAYINLYFLTPQN